MSDKAITTLTVGEKYCELFNTTCRENWQAYAARHGYDLVVLDRPLDLSDRARARSPAWQKCLILEQPELRDYRQVVWIDADILINSRTAPCVADAVPGDRVGAVDAYAIPNPSVFRDVLARQYDDWRAKGTRFVDNLTAAQFYANRRLPPLDRVVQTGVLVASPAHHAPLFRAAYDGYDDMGSPEWNYEMGFLSYELVRAGVVDWIDYRFNTLVGDEIAHHYGFLYSNPFSRFFAPAPQQQSAAVLYNHLSALCLKEMFRNAFFLHFTGMQSLMDRSAAMAVVNRESIATAGLLP